MAPRAVVHVGAPPHPITPLSTARKGDERVEMIIVLLYVEIKLST